jgi:hypothetical protein
MTFQNDDFAIIASLDLDPIKVKLMHKESGEGWSLEQARAVEFEYRRFLYLMKKFPREAAAPSFDVDIFWHYHILDTMKYAQDCRAVFGYFLHHFPYIGLRGEDDLVAHHRVGERMRELYEETFGEDYLKNSLKARIPRDGLSAETTASAFSAATMEARRPTASTRTAFSAAGVDTAFSAATIDMARSAATTAGSPADIAASSAFSAATAGTAFSAATAGTALSAATAGTAFSAATAGPGADSGARISRDADAAGFFSIRPRLDARAGIN